MKVVTSELLSYESGFRIAITCTHTQKKGGGLGWGASEILQIPARE